MKNTKSITWTVDGVEYEIYNIPYQEYEGGIRTYDSGTTLKLLILNDLMIKGEVPSRVDFKLAEEIEL